MRVAVHFCKGSGLGSRLIRLALMSKWNHVAIQVGNKVYESVSSRGVIKRKPRQFYRAWSRIASVEVEVVDVIAMQGFLEAQLGKPYDWKAILSFPFRGSWQARTAWFCSELVYAALRIGGNQLPNRLPASRITPRDLWVALPSAV